MNRTRRISALSFGLAGLLGACAQNSSLPLADGAVLALDVAGLRHQGPLPASLSVSDVARLAVLNNPDLLAMRAQHGVADAQRMEAGILPNPHISLSATPTLAGPGTTTAWNAGVAVDLRALMLRPSLQRAARARLGQVDAEILWREWQVIGQARLLAVQLIEERRTDGLLASLRDLLAQRVADQQKALAAGNATYAALAPDFAALADVETRLRDAERAQLQQRHALAALLGLRPDVPLALGDDVDLALPDRAAVGAALPDLPMRRPDLVALRWGYAAASEAVRVSILSQFPNVSFGPTGGSDNSNVRAFGPQLSFELPVFDRNQGNIAIARATRRQLHDEYDARVAATDGEVRARLDEAAQLERQVQVTRQQLPAVRAAAEAAARTNTLLDPQTRIALLAAGYIRGAELIGLEQNLLEQDVAIETLAGIGMPPSKPLQLTDTRP